MLSVFDLDGTLFDTEVASSHTDIKAFATIGWFIPGGVDYVMEHLPGQVSKVKFAHVAKLLGFNPDPELYTLYRAERERLNDDFIRRGDFTVRPGVEDTLAHIQKNSFLAVATNNPNPRAWLAIEVKGLERFFTKALVFSPDRVGGKGKPDPAMLTYAMQLQGFAPEDSVMVGDTVADMEAAKAAGMHVLGYTDAASPYQDAVAKKLLEAGADALFSDYTPRIWDDMVAPLKRSDNRTPKFAIN